DAARITVFMASSTPVIRRLALPIYVAGSLLFFGLMIWTGWTMVRQQWMMNEMIATLGWPSWIVGLVMPLSGVLSVLCLLDSLFEHRATLGLSAPAADKSPEAP
ncbi:MAG: TRAP transporter small permease, partial [Burkholderiaceae bacterium]